MWRGRWVSRHTIYAWKAKDGGMDVSQAHEAKQLQEENNRIRMLVADLSLQRSVTVGDPKTVAFVAL
jgi:Transposase